MHKHEDLATSCIRHGQSVHKTETTVLHICITSPNMAFDVFSRDRTGSKQSKHVKLCVKETVRQRCMDEYNQIMWTGYR